MATAMDVSVKVHYIYHGDSRCTPFIASLTDLLNLGLTGFEELLRQNVPYLKRFETLRLTYFDEDDTWIDLSDGNYMTFLKNTRCTGGSDFPKLNVKVFDGASPAPPAKIARTEAKGWSRRQLYPYGTQHDKELNENSRTPWRSDENIRTPQGKDDKAFVYKSPVAIDIELKEDELELKRAQLQSLQAAYNDKAAAFNINVSKDKTKKRCAKCHLRVNHTQRNCDIGLCEDIRQCGELDYHPEQKTEINELIKKQQNLERELKALEIELEIKKEAMLSTSKTFERRVRDYVINSNPGKYLLNGVGPGIVNIKLQADIATLKRHYNNRVPEDLERESRYFGVIIESVGLSQHLPRRLPKNPIQETLQTNALYPVRFPPPTATAMSAEMIPPPLPPPLPPLPPTPDADNYQQ